MLASASLWCRFYSLLRLSSTKCSHRLRRSHLAWKKMKSCMWITSSRQAVNTGSGGAIEVSIYLTYFTSAGKRPLNSNCLGRRAPQKDLVPTDVTALESAVPGARALVTRTWRHKLGSREGEQPLSQPSTKPEIMNIKTSLDAFT